MVVERWAEGLAQRGVHEIAGHVSVDGRGGVAPVALLDKGAQICGDYILGEYRFEVLKGVSHWILDEQPDRVAELLDWFAAHPAASRSM